MGTVKENSKEQQQVVDLYNQDISKDKIVELTGYNTRTINMILKNNGIDSMVRYNENSAKIIEYSKAGKTANEIVDLMGVKKHFVYNVLAKDSKRNQENGTGTDEKGKDYKLGGAVNVEAPTGSGKIIINGTRYADVTEQVGRRDY